MKRARLFDLFGKSHRCIIIVSINSKNEKLGFNPVNDFDHIGFDQLSGDSDSAPKWAAYWEQWIMNKIFVLMTMRNTVKMLHGHYH